MSTDKKATIVCIGSYGNQSNPRYLSNVKEEFQSYLKADNESLQIRRVDKCGRVRVIFQLCPAAAKRLEFLYRDNPRPFTRLGISSLKVLDASAVTPRAENDELLQVYQQSSGPTCSASNTRQEISASSNSKHFDDIFCSNAVCSSTANPLGGMEKMLQKNMPTTTNTPLLAGLLKDNPPKTIVLTNENRGIQSPSAKNEFNASTNQNRTSTSSAMGNETPFNSRPFQETAGYQQRAAGPGRHPSFSQVDTQETMINANQLYYGENHTYFHQQQQHNLPLQRSPPDITCSQPQNLYVPQNRMNTPQYPHEWGSDPHSLESKKRRHEQGQANRRHPTPQTWSYGEQLGYQSESDNVIGTHHQWGAASGYRFGINKTTQIQMGPVTKAYGNHPPAQPPHPQFHPGYHHPHPYQHSQQQQYYAASAPHPSSSHHPQFGNMAPNPSAVSRPFAPPPSHVLPYQQQQSQHVAIVTTSSSTTMDPCPTQNTITQTPNNPQMAIPPGPSHNLVEDHGGSNATKDASESCMSDEALLSATISNLEEDECDRLNSPEAASNLPPAPALDASRSAQIDSTIQFVMEQAESGHYDQMLKLKKIQRKRKEDSERPSPNSIDGGLTPQVNGQMEEGLPLISPYAALRPFHQKAPQPTQPRGRGRPALSGRSRGRPCKNTQNKQQPPAHSQVNDKYSDKAHQLQNTEPLFNDTGNL